MSEAHGHGETQEQRVACGQIKNDTTVLDVILQAINNTTMQIGNAVEFNAQVETSHGPYAVHLHLCVQPVQRPPVN